MAERNRRKTISGLVTSRTGDKSVKVTYFYRIRHPRYLKEVKRKTVVHAHDEANECGVGDRVIIMETRPISKLKRFRIVKVVDKAPVIG
ncbi:MAG: 30S ribosomal protein S17 [Verrucomicrobia bacterium]|nr:30S ribosomal protein S17 [Verrucomicrobiota bacterium]